jgi:hypothetical protein
MAKIRKYKLSWEASASDAVVGYKLYWSEDTKINYDSKSIDLGNVTEFELPDDAILLDAPVTFGVAAFDKDGNESDITTLKEPFQIRVPKAPARILLTRSDDFKMMNSNDTAEPDNDQDINDDSIAVAIESNKDKKPVRLKYYDDIGYRGSRR